MFSYLLQINGTAQGDALFATKPAAMRAFARDEFDNEGQVIS